MAEHLILVRHGQSVGAGPGRLHGHDDRPLSPRGRAQADALAVELAGVLSSGESVCCVVSPLQRARQTAEHALAGSGLVAEPLQELVEVDVGDWEGLTFAEAAARSPEEAARWASWD
ncbi:MAG: histidine phosphatase family protein, partial [Actinobacteria bacterium]|nr:histidine phosphatase family protein [Actinomycetota bacterium]